MTEKTTAAKLADLEKPRNSAADANIHFHRAAVTGDKELIAAAQINLDQARKNHHDAGISDRSIDIAAQAVLDERGESHTEENILPPGTTPKEA